MKNFLGFGPILCILELIKIFQVFSFRFYNDTAVLDFSNSSAWSLTPSHRSKFCFVFFKTLFMWYIITVESMLWAIWNYFVSDQADGVFNWEKNGRWRGMGVLLFIISNVCSEWGLFSELCLLVWFFSFWSDGIEVLVPPSCYEFGFLKRKYYYLVALCQIRNWYSDHLVEYDITKLYF